MNLVVKTQGGGTEENEKKPQKKGKKKTSALIRLFLVPENGAV